VPTSTRRYGSNQRWLLKALREVAHEVQQLTWGLDDAMLTRRPPPEAGVREELLWTLQWAGSAWEHRGVHRHRGEIPLDQFVHEINERDLEAMWSLRRLCEAGAGAARRRA